MRGVLIVSFALAALSPAACADEAAIREKLRSRVQVKYEKTPLVEALKNLGEQAGVKFWYSEEEIESDGGTLKEDVTLDGGEMQLDSALHFILERQNNLAWLPTEGDVLVTTYSRMMNRVTTKVYDLSVIIDALQSKQSAEKVSPERLRSLLINPPVGKGAGGYELPIRWFRELSGGGGQGFFQFGNSAQPMIPQGRFATIGEVVDPVWLSPRFTTRREYVALLAGILTSTTDGAYEENGGASLDILEESFVVTAQRRVHDQIAGLLQALEQVLSQERPPSFQLALRAGYPYPDDDAIRTSLHQIGSFETKDELLPVALGRFAKQAGVRLWIAEKEINADGGSVEGRITISLKDFPYETILERLLHPRQLEYAIEEGVIVVSTSSKMSERYYPALYNVSGIPESQVVLESYNYPQMPDPFKRNKLIAALMSHFGIWNHDHNGERVGSAYSLTPSIVLIDQSQRRHRRIAKFLSDLRQRKPPANAKPDLRPEFLTRVYPVFDPDAVEPSVTILKKLLANDQIKLMEVVKDSIVLQCTDEGHIRAEAYFEAIESAHRRRQERVKPATPAGTPGSQP